MIKKVFFLFLLTISLYAHNTLLAIYRVEGIEKVEQILENELTSKESWLETLKDINTTFGYFENSKTFLVCDKNSSTLKLYTQDENKIFKLQNSYNAFTGKIHGDKQVEGDMKTPIGIYTLKKKLSNVDKFYGPMAFVTSYPNIYDKLRSKNGSGIWIHGLPIDNEKRDSFTKGCIAIPNSDILCLDPNLFINNTLLYIDEKVHFQHTKDDLANLLSNLFSWKRAWKQNDLAQYLSFYDPTFIHSTNKKNYKEFKEYKRRVFLYNDKKSIIFKNITIVPYPTDNNENLFRISFFEIYRSKRIHFSGNKILIVKLLNGKMQIITEK